MTEQAPLANHFQIAYVTTDLDQAIGTFATQFGVPSFRVVKDVTAPVVSPHGSGALCGSVAYAWVGGTMFEIIQPISGEIDIYRHCLPHSGFGLKFHHLAYQFVGEQADWLRFRDNIVAERKLGLMSPDDSKLQFVYIDDRETLGHFVEYVWFRPERAEDLAAIPRH